MRIKSVLLSKKAELRLESIGDYIFENTKSKYFTRSFLSKLKSQVKSLLSNHPYCGRDVSDEFGDGVRKIVCEGFTFLYQVNEKLERIEILTIFRENLP